MSITEQIQSLDNNIKEAKKIMDLGDALERLQANKDFRAVIKAGYFEQEAIRLVHLKGAPHMQTVEYQLSIVKQMDAIASLNQYFQTVFHAAGMADKAITSDEEAREELLAEGLQ
jgi:hypothetical protein